jgi:hypothetical protein
MPSSLPLPHRMTNIFWRLHLTRYRLGWIPYPLLSITSYNFFHRMNILWK